MFKHCLSGTITKQHGNLVGVFSEPLGVTTIINCVLNYQGDFDCSRTISMSSILFNFINNVFYNRNPFQWIHRVIIYNLVIHCLNFMHDIDYLLIVKH